MMMFTTFLGVARNIMIWITRMMRRKRMRRVLSRMWVMAAPKTGVVVAVGKTPGEGSNDEEEDAEDEWS